MEILTARTDDGSMPAFVDRWFDSWAEACRAGLLHGRRPPAPTWHPQERLAVLRRQSQSHAVVVVAATDGDAVLGGARIMLPLLDNRHLAMLEIGVHPDHWRRGVGSALLAESRAVAAAATRTTLLAEVDRPYVADEPDAGTDWPGSRFAAAHGFTVAIGDVRRELPLPPDESVLAPLRTRAEAASSGYGVRSWTGRTAEADLPAIAAMRARMSTDPPNGELDNEPETWDAARVLDEESRYVAQGYEWLTALATAPDGEPVGFTQLGRSRWQPELVWQWDTLVVPDHRGHRLGLRLKIAALDDAAGLLDGAVAMTTWNAASNGPMIAVNEAMGYRPVETTEEWQGPV